MFISDFVSALEATRARLGAVTAEMEPLFAERARIASLPPHADEIMTAYRRGLAAASREFDKRLSHFLNDENAAKPGAAQAVAKVEAQLTTLPAMLPSRDYTTLFHEPSLSFGGFPLDPAAVTCFLAPLIAEAIPALVERLCPQAKARMTKADRERAIAELDAQLAPLRAEQAELRSTLEAAQSAAGTADRGNPSMNELATVEADIARLSLEREAARHALSEARNNRADNTVMRELERERDRVEKELDHLADKRNWLRRDLTPRTN